MEVKQVIVFRKDLNVRKGKLAAQVAHAAMQFLLEGYDGSRTLEKTLSTLEKEWLNSGFAKVVVYVESEQELLELVARGREQNITVHPIVDAGRTEFHGVPTLTCASFGPDDVNKLDPITGHLKLL